MDAGVRGQQLNPFKHELYESVLEWCSKLKKNKIQIQIKPCLKLKTAQIVSCYQAYHAHTGPSDPCLQVSMVSEPHADSKATFSEKHIASCLIDLQDMKYGAPSNISIITFHAFPPRASQPALR